MAATSRPNRPAARNTLITRNGGTSIPSQEDYGRVWDFNHTKIRYDGSDAPLRPLGEAHEWGVNWDEDQGTGEYLNSYTIPVSSI
ncbi:respiratory nitrate reductase beta subunit [Halococcus thailandensis JCM 13552]|uniref:Respiratory nitrate reductase beta subunit n=1 Tax=Halococcus thailandensis JCM 13552 TaxID=1227457 RepID=M0NEY7_9EURY|nr:respiratory nitrate reductase beta subunit [Halococcus thailandensis JCM 13552]